MCPIVFQGHSSNFKVTQNKKSPILTRIVRFQTVTPVLIHPGVWEDAQSLMKNRLFESNLSKITRPVAAIKSLRFAFLVSGLCRRHGFGRVIQFCFGISVSNFMCVSFVAVGKSLKIFSYVAFKMAAWWPYWIFRFLHSNFSLVLIIKSTLQQHITDIYG